MTPDNAQYVLQQRDVTRGTPWELAREARMTYGRALAMLRAAEVASARDGLSLVYRVTKAEA